MTEREAINVMIDKCEHTFLLLHTDDEFVKALATLMTAADKLDIIRKCWKKTGGNPEIFDKVTEEEWTKICKLLFDATTIKENSNKTEIPDQLTERMDHIEKNLDFICSKVLDIREKQNLYYLKGEN